MTDQLGSGEDLSSADRVKLGRELGKLQAIAHHADRVPQRQQELQDLRTMLHEYSASSSSDADVAAGHGGNENQNHREQADAKIENELREMALAELADCERSAFTASTN